MEINRIEELKESLYFGQCKQAVIKGSALTVTADCPAMGKKWIGFAVSYNYKIEDDKEIYLIRNSTVKSGKKNVRLTTSIDLAAFPFRYTHWAVLAVYEEDGDYYGVNLIYKLVKPSTKEFLFGQDSFSKGKDIVFCNRIRGGYLGLTYRERGRYDGRLTRLKEYIALSKFNRHKDEYKKRKIYLIYEKLCQKAQDNGYHLFRYCMENNMEEYLDAEIYYVIEKDSVDMKKLAPYADHVLEFMSLKFMLAILGASLLISPDSRNHAYIWQNNTSLIAPKLSKKNHIFLGHGVLALKRLNDSFTARSMKSVLCTVTSDSEAAVVRDELGFEPDRIVNTGYARFDVLHDTSGDSKRILMMPTHRSWLFGVERDVFTASEYYRRYMSILNSDRLINLLEEKDAYLDFYVHPSIKEHTDAFSSVSDRIRVVPYGETSLDDLMMQSKMLITDYSSICWDMYYMDKPILFYQYDVDKYLETWGSYVDLEKDLPGERTDDTDRLIDMIGEYADAGFAMKPEYEEGRKDRFAYIDDQNCFRICEVLRKRNYGL